MTTTQTVCQELASAGRGEHASPSEPPSADELKHPPVSKKLRFEIFKRDNFQCIYCGRTPPDVLLQVDHVLPRASGGGNAEINLVTACRDCNLGKGARHLSSLPRKLSLSIEERAEKLEQMKALADMTIREQENLDEMVRKISDRWVTLDGDDCLRWMVDEEIAAAIRNFLQKLSASDVLRAVDITFTKQPKASAHGKFRYFCGVCWRMIKKDYYFPPTSPGEKPGDV